MNPDTLADTPDNLGPSYDDECLARIDPHNKFSAAEHGVFVANAEAITDAMAATTPGERAQALAGKTIDAHRDETFKRNTTVHASPPWPGCHYGILARAPHKLYPTADPKTLAAQKLWPYRRCDVALSPQCEKSNAQRTLVIARGEYACCYRSCTACAAWLRPIVAPSADEIHQMRYAINAWAVDGNAAFEADVAERVGAGEDPATARVYVHADAERHVAKMLDEMRENDPARAKELVTMVRRMFAEFGKPVPYPFK